VALLGGSFNPVHIGHLGLAQYALTHTNVDEIWLLVSPQNPLKRAAELLDEQTRLAWARKAVADIPRLQASDFEFHLPRPSYTWHTLAALREAYPDTAFSLLIGADNWVHFGHWAHAELLIQTYHLYVYPRIGCNATSAALPPSVELLDAPLFPYSSTSIREAVRRGQDISRFVPACIKEEVVRAYAL